MILQLLAAISAVSLEEQLLEHFGSQEMPHRRAFEYLRLNPTRIAVSSWCVWEALMC